MEDHSNETVEDIQDRKMKEAKAREQKQAEKDELLRKLFEFGLFMWVLLGPWTVNLIPWGTGYDPQGWNFWIGLGFWFGPVFVLYMMAKKHL